MAFSLDHSGYGRIELLVSEVRHVNGNFIDHCCGVVFARWWRLGIFSLARLAARWPSTWPTTCRCRDGMSQLRLHKIAGCSDAVRAPAVTNGVTVPGQDSSCSTVFPLMNCHEHYCSYRRAVVN